MQCGNAAPFPRLRTLLKCCIPLQAHPQPRPRPRPVPRLNPRLSPSPRLQPQLRPRPQPRPRPQRRPQRRPRPQPRPRQHQQVRATSLHGLRNCQCCTCTSCHTNDVTNGVCPFSVRCKRCSRLCSAAPWHYALRNKMLELESVRTRRHCVQDHCRSLRLWQAT